MYACARDVCMFFIMYVTGMHDKVDHPVINSEKAYIGAVCCMPTLCSLSAPASSFFFPRTSMDSHYGCKDTEAFDSLSRDQPICMVIFFGD